MTSSLYNPSAFHESNPATLLAFIRRYPFASLVTSGSQPICVSHVPILAHRGPDGKLFGHLARANAHWQVFDGRQALAIFHGPDSYISPAWYVSAPMVPTWNYAVVHVTGTISKVIEPERVIAILQATANAFEADRPEPWRPADVPSEYLGQLSKSVVGFEIEVAAVEGKFKLSQNLTAADQAGAIAGLLREPRHGRAELARAMAEACGHDGTTQPPHSKL